MNKVKGTSEKVLQSPEDPWIHRAQCMKCRTCMWFVEKNPQIGRCRKRSPTLQGYPAVYPADWCGDHKLDETKIQ